MDQNPPGTRREPSGHREQKRIETRLRIAEVAATLALDGGANATTVDQIVESAGVGRATFFRYFDSKECAISVGLSHITNFIILSVLHDLPEELSPVEALRVAHAALADGYEERHALYYEQVQLTRSSPAMEAWSSHTHAAFESAYVEALLPHFEDLQPDDVRPGMLAAMNTAVIRLACDQFLADAGRSDLPTLIQRRLAAIEIVSC